MFFEKTEKISTEWLLHIGNHEIPMVALGNFLKMVFICVSIALAYNMGTNWALVEHKLLSEQTAPGYCTGGICYNCTTAMNGNQLALDCTPLPGQLNITGRIPNIQTQG